MEILDRLAKEIMKYLDKHEIGYMTAIYYDNKRYSKFNDEAQWDYIEDIKASDYTDYANDDTITITFEGRFYNVINFFEGPYKEFEEIVDSFGYTFERGEAWNLALYEKGE